MAKKNTWELQYMREIAKLRKEQEEQQRQLNEIIARDAEEFYACLILVLTLDKYGYKWPEKKKATLLSHISEVWNDTVTNDVNVVEWCLAETGIDIRDELRGDE